MLFIFAISNHQNAEKYRTQMEIGYQRALNELSEYLSEIDTSLLKGSYASTPTMISETTAALIRSSFGAKGALSQLPVSDLELDNTFKFLSQLGDYSQYLNRRAAVSGALTDDEYQNLRSFLPILSGISQEVDNAAQAVTDANFFTGAANSEIKDAENSAGSIGFSDSIQSAESGIENYPTLIYDGPYSDHIMQMSARALENESGISPEQALDIAKKYCDNPSYVGDENSSIEQYCFANGNTSIGITKKGGLLCYMISYYEVGEPKISDSEAIRKAQSFLKSAGYDNMKESYYATYDGKCVINFAYTDSDITCYPDLIKVTVALDTGNIISADARGYLMNHYKRSLQNAVLTRDEAAARINTSLSILDSSLCIIPSSGKYEYFCYEFRCSDDNGREYLVYVDALTGEEDDILLLLYSDNGTLTK